VSKKLDGKVALITGGSKGIGRSFANHLTTAGARIAVLARPSSELEDLTGAFGKAVLPIACDVSDGAAVRAAVAQSAAHFGRLDIVINNAAISSLVELETATSEEITREFAVNVIGPANVSSAAIPHLRAAGGGDLVFISSESIEHPYPYMTLYAATKGALETLASGLRSELREQGTRVSVLRVGSVLSSGNLASGWQPDRIVDMMAKAERWGRNGLAGAPMSVESVAETLLAVVSLPRDVNIELVARSALPAPM
jgi:NAD(P)-dependent dehydrogenase (short-subunit alcohol dehydrogenase family)